MVMNESYYIPSFKVNGKTSHLVMNGYHIVVEGITYQQLSSKPRGRSIQRTLKGIENPNERLVIYS